MNNSILRYILVVCLFLSPRVAQAQPTNDNCTGAIPLTVGTTCSYFTYTTAAATATSGVPAPGCASYNGADVWFSVVVPPSGNLTVDTQTGTITDGGMAWYTGTCAGLTLLECDDDESDNGLMPRISRAGLTPGTTIYVRIWEYGGDNNGSFGICATTVPLMTNDNCATAIPLAVGATCNYLTYSDSGATASTGMPAPGCANYSGADVWFTAVVPPSGSLTVDMTQGTMTDSGMAWYTGSCAGMTLLECDDDDSDNGWMSKITRTGLTPGSTIYIRVWGAWGSTGTFGICATTPPPPPANDNCSGAIPLTVNAGNSCASTTTGTTAGATQSQTGCAGNADDDVWYSFVATASTHQVMVTPGTLWDPVLQVFSGGCGGLTNLSCQDSAGGTGIESATVSGLTPGSTYYVRVYSWGAAGNQGTFTLCVNTPTPMTNDNCSGAISLIVNPSTACVNSTTGTTLGATQSMTGCTGTADDDVWFSFVATSTMHVVTISTITLYDAVIQIFSGSCGSLTNVLCEDNTFGTSDEAATLTGLTPGNTYYVRVYSWFSDVGDRGSFEICVTTPTPPTPCAAGPGTGVTDLACPSVISGGLGLSGADPEPLNCLGSTCTELEATYLQLGNTSTYTFEQIAYNPPYQFDCLANPVSINIDDVWSPTVTLPFNFCFYGNNYNQVLISSNGVITFDMINHGPGGYSTWSFNNTLPSNALFLNSIFGVYHDIDPSLGGEVGWELITLNTGCRALVAAWHDVPMFSCTSQRYTGMIVLYENTNVIEVYVEEKPLCSGWNGGNALIGLQNATGTAAVSPPGRNSVTSDWTGIPGGEAWRFTPAGPSITSIRWFEGPTATGTPISTGMDVITVCPSATTTYTAQVSYSLCNGTILTEEESVVVTISPSKIWNGSVNDNWNVANNWTPPGVPTSLDCVVVPDVVNDSYIQGTSFDAFAYSVNVQNGGLLQINSGNNLTVTDIVRVDAGGTFNIKNSGSLIQINDVPNIGTMNMERITPPIYRFDYVYWNSPVTQASNFTLGMLSPNTQYDKYYSWEPCCSGIGGTGNWIQESAGSIMTPTKGYIVRGPNSFSTSPGAKSPYTANFIGTFNNGSSSAPISYGTALPEDDKWNLIGNPYPSAVSGTDFILSLNNSTILDGTLYFWAHNTAPSEEIEDPFYGDFEQNYTGTDYATWNLSGGTAAMSGGQVPNGYISAGQSFMVKAKGNPGNAIFENYMRRPDYNLQFFRPDGSRNLVGVIDEDPRERHRIWLNLQTSSGLFNQTLVAYVQGATMGKDREFDGEHFSDGAANLFSLLDAKRLVIQGRALPFSADDQVPLGYSVAQNEQALIRISEVDGLFVGQSIYLEDKWLNVIHDLKSSPYHFMAQEGTHLDRFVLRYDNPNAMLMTAGHEVRNTVAYIAQEHLNVQASVDIKSIELFDVSGKRVATYSGMSSPQVRIPFQLANGVYLARIELTDGQTVTKKLVH
jgi:hypothetical protein